METFADYLLGEQDLINKMDILNKLQRMLREKRGISIFFNNTVIFKTGHRGGFSSQRSYLCDVEGRRWKISKTAFRSDLWTVSDQRDSLL